MQPVFPSSRFQSAKEIKKLTNGIGVLNAGPIVFSCGDYRESICQSERA